VEVRIVACRARGVQRGHGEANLLSELTPCRCFWRFTAPQTSTGQVPPKPIRRAHQGFLHAGLKALFEIRVGSHLEVLITFDLKRWPGKSCEALKSNNNASARQRCGGPPPVPGRRCDQN
jgi:hypothetical protein